MQHGVTGTVSHGTGTLHRRLAEVGHVAAKRTLVNLAVFQTVKRHAEVFKLDHGFGRLAAHEFDGVLITQPVRPLHGVVHVPVPAVFLHVAKAGRNAPLGGNGVRTGREHLGQDGSFQTGLGELQRGTQARTTGAHDYGVKTTDRYGHYLIPHTTTNE